MKPHAPDVIVALSTAAGPGGRAVVRLSGPGAAKVVAPLFHPDISPEPARRLLEGALRLPGLASPLPADLYLLPAPNTYTGEDVVEIHTLSCPPLLDLLTASLLQSGARAARPGEFTLRAFLAGKLDLTRAEAVQAVVESGDEDELKRALTQLAGGLARPLEGLREDLLNLLADVEAALDFADEDITFVGRDDLLHRLTRGHGAADGGGAAARRSGPWPTGRSAWCWRVGRTPARAACSTRWAGRRPWSVRSRGRRGTTWCRGLNSAARRWNWWTRRAGRMGRMTLRNRPRRSAENRRARPTCCCCAYRPTNPCNRRMRSYCDRKGRRSSVLQPSAILRFRNRGCWQ